MASPLTPDNCLLLACARTASDVQRLEVLVAPRAGGLAGRGRARQPGRDAGRNPHCEPATSLRLMLKPSRNILGLSHFW